MAVRRKIRWDRIAVAAVVLIILIFLLGSCMQSCSDRRAEKQQQSNAQQANAPTEEQTQASDASAPAATTEDAASKTMVNVPVILTDAAGSVGGNITTTETTASDPAEESSSEPAYVLPAGYQDVQVPLTSLYSGNLVLVDKSHPSHLAGDELELEQVYYAEDRPETYEISYPGHTSLNKNALSKFNRLMKAYYAATNNTEIMFNYGYLEDGKEKSNPESSTGLDVQIHLKKQDGSYDFITNVTPYTWLFEHMASYGFVQRYPESKSDITGEKGSYTALRYVGVPHAAYMAEHDLCLEEYLDMLRGSHNFFTGTVLEYSTTESTYHIYYVPAREDGILTVPVPSGGSYEISGNNTDGFIVTAIVG